MMLKWWRCVTGFKENTVRKTGNKRYWNKNDQKKKGEKEKSEYPKRHREKRKIKWNKNVLIRSALRYHTHTPLHHRLLILMKLDHAALRWNFFFDFLFLFTLYLHLYGRPWFVIWWGRNGVLCVCCPQRISS